MCNETKLYLLYVYFHKGKKAIFKKRKFVNKSASNIILNRTKNLNSMNLLIVIFWWLKGSVSVHIDQLCLRNQVNN